MSSEVISSLVGVVVGTLLGVWLQKRQERERRADSVRSIASLILLETPRIRGRAEWIQQRSEEGFADPYPIPTAALGRSVDRIVDQFPPEPAHVLLELLHATEEMESLRQAGAPLEVLKAKARWVLDRLDNAEPHLLRLRG